MYRVFGYTDDCQDFDLEFDSFVEAIKAYKELQDWCVVFISGVSDAVRKALY